MTKADPGGSAAMSRTVDIGVIIDDAALPGLIDGIDEAIERAARAALAALPQDMAPGRDLEASVLVAGDPRVAALNQAHRGKDGPTNVLSFPATDFSAPAGSLSGDPGQPVMLGDIVIASGVLRAEAEKAEISAGDHLSHLIVHGMLHLLGYDHETDIDADEMEAIEIRALESIGIANPYEREAGA